MFSLVDDVESYPDFLPWCKRAEIHNRTDQFVEATLEMQKGSLSKRFTTRNSREEFASIGLTLLGGPFRHLEGGWQFRDLDGDGCEVRLELEFEFENRMLDLAFGPFFESTCNSLVDAFSRRAQVVLGQR
jgi:ribosome-associated toxin RatA of RatAB toxin-antitoxin module